MPVTQEGIVLAGSKLSGIAVLCQMGCFYVVSGKEAVSVHLKFLLVWKIIIYFILCQFLMMSGYLKLRLEQMSLREAQGNLGSRNSISNFHVLPAFLGRQR